MDSDNMEKAKTPKRWAMYLSPGSTSLLFQPEWPWNIHEHPKTRTVDTDNWAHHHLPGWISLGSNGNQHSALSGTKQRSSTAALEGEEIHPLCVFTLPFCVSFSPWQQREKNLESLTLFMIHTVGIIQSRPAVKPLLPCDGKGHFWLSDCSRSLLLISHEETITDFQEKPRLPVWNTRGLEKPRDLSTEVRHTPMGKVLSSWHRESFCACKHLITLHLLWNPLLKSCFNSPTAAS